MDEPLPEENSFKPIGLTPKQEKQWEDTMSLMLWTAPGFRHLFYKLLSNHDGKHACLPVHESRCPIAATDAKNIMINPDRFFEFDMRERVFILAHEVVHNVYGDVPFLRRCLQSGTVPMDDGTTLPFDMRTMQHAMDYRINALLEESKIGRVPVGKVLLDKEIATANSGITETYKKTYEKHEQDGTLGQGGTGGFDWVYDPNASTGQGPDNSQQNQQQWGVEIRTAQALESMKSKGSMPGALSRMFEEILNPVVPWTEHIRGIFNRKVGSGSYNWRRPDRRFIVRDLYMPSRSGNGAGHVVVWCDTSGSIGDSELCKYLAELSAIVDECQPKRLTIHWCDAHIHRTDEIEEASDMAKLTYDAATEGVGGGGGTSCNPVFEWMAELDEKPEVFIGFTDGYVTFPPHEPDFVTIWASTTDHDYPWGDVVKLNP